MTLKEWVAAMLGHKPQTSKDEVHARLDMAQNQIAGQLARMQGKTRDQVLNEAYRRADEILASKRR